jgi:hypothetical protein
MVGGHRSIQAHAALMVSPETEVNPMIVGTLPALFTRRGQWIPFERGREGDLMIELLVYADEYPSLWAEGRVTDDNPTR